MFKIKALSIFIFLLASCQTSLVFLLDTDTDVDVDSDDNILLRDIGEEVMDIIVDEVVRESFDPPAGMVPKRDYCIGFFNAYCERLVDCGGAYTVFGCLLYFELEVVCSGPDYDYFWCPEDMMEHCVHDYVMGASCFEVETGNLPPLPEECQGICRA